MLAASPTNPAQKAIALGRETARPAARSSHNPNAPTAAITSWATIPTRNATVRVRERGASEAEEESVVTTEGEDAGARWPESKRG